MAFLWGLQPYVPTHEVFKWGLMPIPIVGTYRILGHEFTVVLADISNIGHEFSVIPRASKLKDISEQDSDKLLEALNVEYEEPEQLDMEPVLDVPAETKPSEQQRTEDAIDDLQEWITAASQMQDVLGNKLKDRQVTISAKTNPTVRDAIRRLFGKDSETITYDMFKQAMKWRSEMLKERRQGTYGTNE